MHSVFKPLCHPALLGQRQRHAEKERKRERENIYLRGNSDKKGKLKNRQMDEKKKRKRKTNNKDIDFLASDASDVDSRENQKTTDGHIRFEKQTLWMFARL